MDRGVRDVPAITVETYGQVEDARVRAILEDIESCYRALTVPLPEAVVLALFETLRDWQAYSTRKRMEVGVVTAGEEGFLATHDAWEGFPRLNVCLERLLAQPPLLQQGALHQVVAHSVLHGRPDYYRFAIPRRLILLSRSRGVEMEVLQQVLYFVAIAIKGLEAATLLVRHGFIDDQAALALYQMEKEEDDLTVWKMARWEPRARLLYLAAQLRPLLYARPLFPHVPGLSESARAMLAHLPPETAARLHTLADTLAAQCTGDTHRDVTEALALLLDAVPE
jgi:hypothetical protein